MYNLIQNKFKYSFKKVMRSIVILLNSLNNSKDIFFLSFFWKWCECVFLFHFYLQYFLRNLKNFYYLTTRLFTNKIKCDVYYQTNISLCLKYNLSSSFLNLSIITIQCNHFWPLHGFKQIIIMLTSKIS